MNPNSGMAAEVSRTADIARSMPMAWSPCVNSWRITSAAHAAILMVKIIRNQMRHCGGSPQTGCRLRWARLARSRPLPAAVGSFCVNRR